MTQSLNKYDSKHKYNYNSQSDFVQKIGNIEHFLFNVRSDLHRKNNMSEIKLFEKW